MMPNCGDMEILPQHVPTKTSNFALFHFINNGIWQRYVQMFSYGFVHPRILII